MLRQVWLTSVAGLVCIPCLQARSLNGFLTPEFVQGQKAPFVPVSTTADIDFGERIRGEIRLKDIGRYRLLGKQTGGRLQLELLGEDGARAGEAQGRMEDNLLELELNLSKRGELWYRGRLSLEAYVEWRASEPMKSGREPHDKASRKWYEPGFDDSEWELIDLPDDGTFGEKRRHARYYRSHFSLSKPQEAVSVSLTDSAGKAGETSQESESFNAIFASDDGIAIYINGRLLGRWIGDNDGCVNDPTQRCGDNVIVPPVSIPAEFVQPGRNLMAVRVLNVHCCYSYFSLLVTRVRTRLLSPAEE